MARPGVRTSVWAEGMLAHAQAAAAWGHADVALAMLARTVRECVRALKRRERTDAE